LLAEQSGTGDDLAGLRVLLAEDNEFNQQLATALLTRAGIEVGIACDGAEAVQAATQGRFDAVLMDIQMPNMDGFEATRQIRKIPALAGLPIIAMTANAMSGDRERCLAAGMNDYITKPIQVGVMYATLGRWTQRNAPLAGADATRRRQVSGAFPSIEPDKAIARMGGEDTYLTVLEKFIPNQSQAVQSIQDALAAHDRTTAERLAHTLKGIAATIGAKTLSKFARQLEEAIHENKAENRPQLIAATATELAQVLASAKAYLQAHASATEGGGPSHDTVSLDTLLEQLTAKLKAFDSDAANTMREINRQIKGTEAARQFAKLNRYMNDYDYENALMEAQRLTKEQT
jgi:CheY-like chemotaxis protein